jgi:hypothetical protein
MKASMVIGFLAAGLTSAAAQTDLFGHQRPLVAGHSTPLLLAQSSIACGIAPIPPIGCRLGSCVCDENGNNCHWTFICR